MRYSLIIDQRLETETVPRDDAPRQAFYATKVREFEMKGNFGKKKSHAP